MKKLSEMYFGPVLKLRKKSVGVALIFRHSFNFLFFLFPQFALASPVIPIHLPAVTYF